MKKVLAGMCFVLASAALAENEYRDQPFLIGHNLTPTSYTLKEGQMTLGTYAVAYAFSDNLMLGTSPTMILLYNMPMLNLRYGRPIAGTKFRWGFDFSYFKTLPYFAERFRQHSVFARGILSYDATAAYKVHASFGAQYFMDDTRPYSLRLDAEGSGRSHLSFSTLHEVWFTDEMGMFYEAGLAGLDYPTKWLHLGTSFFYHWGAGYAQAGLSDTFSLGRIGGTAYSHWIHLEVQLQFLL